MRFCNCGKLLGSWLRERGLSMILLPRSATACRHMMQAVPFNAHQVLHVVRGRLWRVYESVNSTYADTPFRGEGCGLHGETREFPSVPLPTVCQFLVGFIVKRGGV